MSIDFKKVKEQLDLKSPTFCSHAHNYSIIWLSQGKTSSCCHSKIYDINQFSSDFHNIEEKRELRKSMKLGQQHEDCSFCWNIENSNDSAVSNRIIYSSRYLDNNYTHENGNSVLTSCEVSFDSFCDFACIYCNSNFSTSWNADLKINGPYENLKSEDKSAYSLPSENTFDKITKNPNILSFWSYLESEESNSLKMLRLTGGEPLLSPEFPEFVNKLKKEKFKKITFALNTNLGQNKSIESILELDDLVEDFRIYTSNETFGDHAEYTRAGLKWDIWINNLEKILQLFSNRDKRHVVITASVNALSIFGFLQFLEEVKRLKNINGNLEVISNPVFFPNFLSLNVLPKDILISKITEIEQWLEHNISYFRKNEIAGFMRIISFARQCCKNTILKIEIQKDFKSFVSQYDIRKNKNILISFRDVPEFISWIKSTK